MLIGGTGVDKMTGGVDADKFIFQTRQDSGVGVGNRDIIMDFESGLDKILLGGLKIGSTNDIHFTTQANGNTIIGIDFDHNGSIDFEIQLNHSTVTLHDLLF